MSTIKEYAESIKEQVEFSAFINLKYYEEYEQDLMSEEEYINEAQKISTNLLMQVYKISGLYYDIGEVQKAENHFNKAKSYDETLLPSPADFKNLIITLIRENVESIDDVLQKFFQE